MNPPRVAVAHLYATGPYHPGGPHGLLHVGLLPLDGPASEVREWVLNPGRRFGDGLYQAARISNETAGQAPTWADAAADIQATFGEFAAILLLDRAGQPSPERAWLEQVVLAGLPNPPPGIALDQLTGFFCPDATLSLDDADELLAAFRADPPDAGTAHAAYQASAPQLPFVLLAMRRALRRVLASVLRPAPAKGGGQWQPVRAFLAQAVGLAGKTPAARAFRCLSWLAQQPACCDEPPPPGQTTRQATAYRLLSPVGAPSAPSAVAARHVLGTWLAAWRDLADGAGAPPLLTETDGIPTPDQLEEAFQELGSRLRHDSTHVTKTQKDSAYHRRAEQVQYATQLAAAMSARGVHALEAGTGTGKTYGYLVPALEYLRQVPDGRVFVATSTKNLQDQMRTGELPALFRDPDGKRHPRYAHLRWALLKGKNGYLCADALAREREPAPDQPPRLVGWADTLAWLYLALQIRDCEGECETTSPAVEALIGRELAALRRRVTADRACRHGPFRGWLRESFDDPEDPGALCVYPTHGKRAEAAHLIITNHHKLAMLPPKLRARGGVCIIDEADRFPDNYRNALASKLDAAELPADLLRPLLGGPAVPGSADAPGSAAQTGILPETADLLRTTARALWQASGAGEYVPVLLLDGPANEIFEEADDARLAKLRAEANLRAQVAAAVAGTPTAADAQAVAETAAALAAAVQKFQRRRRAAYAADAQHTAAGLALFAIERELPRIGRLFMAGRGQAAVLPFPLDDARWDQPFNVRPQPQAPYGWHAFGQQLCEELAPLETAFRGGAQALRATHTHLLTAFDLVPDATDEAPDGTDDTDPSAPPSPEARLCMRLHLLTERAERTADLLAQMRAEFPCRAYLHLLNRTHPDPLAWRLERVPFDLAPYLVGAEPPPADAPKPLFQGEPEPPLFQTFGTVVFTSATLYLNESTAYFRRLLDLPGAFRSETRISSPFDHHGAEQVRVLLPQWLQKWDKKLRNGELAAWREHQFQTLLPLLLAFEGRSLVLFTSNDDMQAAAAWLRDPLSAHDIELLCQRGPSRWEMSRFRRLEQSVLLGVDRMWAGVDFPGPTLSQIIVWRAPLPNLSEPLNAHRWQYAGDAYWKQYFQPAAALKMRQGFGRLVRRKGDRGAFTLLDARLRDPFYAYVLSELTDLPVASFATPTELFESLHHEVLLNIWPKAELERRALTPTDLAHLIPAPA